MELKGEVKCIDIYGYEIRLGDSVAFSWAGNIQIGEVIDYRPIKNCKNCKWITRWELKVKELRTDKEVTVKRSTSTVKI